MNKLYVFLLITILAISSVQALTLGSIRSEEYIFTDELLMHVNIFNENNRDRDTYVSILIPELDAYERTDSFEVVTCNNYGKYFLIPADSLKQGEYWAKVTANDGTYSDSKWVLLDIY